MTIPTPYELVKLLGIMIICRTSNFAKKGLRDCQYEAVTELEKVSRVVRIAP